MRYSSKRTTLQAGQPNDTYATDYLKENLYSSKISPYKPPPLMTNSKYNGYCGQQDLSLTPKPQRTPLERPLKQPENYSRSINVTPERQKMRKQNSFVLLKTKEAVPYELKFNMNVSLPEKSTQTDRSQLVFKNQDINSPYANRSTGTSSLRQTLTANNSWQLQTPSFQISCEDISLKRKIQLEVQGRKEIKSKFASRNQSRNNSKIFPYTLETTTNITEPPIYKSKTPTRTPRVSQDKSTASPVPPRQRNPMSQTDPSGSYFQLTHSKRLTMVKPNDQLRLDDFQLGACKGQGRFGKVFPALHRKTGFLVGIKKIAKEAVRGILEQFVRQIKICLFVNHPNIVRMYGFFCDAQNVYLLIEYMEEGSLYHHVRQAHKFTEEDAGAKLYQICEAVRYLHSLDILHRDIKPENIVVSNGVCKLCDFGWATYSKDRRNTYCGTLDYVCPEILQGQSYDNFVDVWAIGVLAYELLVGKAPFYHISKKETMKSIMNCDFSIPNHLSVNARLFITKALQKTPDLRFTIESLLKDRFLSEVSREI